MRVQFAWGFALVAAATLGACGGDSDAPEITIAGTAAKGAALAGATVSAKCAAGTSTIPTTTASAGGTYTLTITGASLPCVLKAVGTEGSTFHSLVGGTGSTGSFVANITPLTEMVVAQAAQELPASLYGRVGVGTSVRMALVDAGVVYVEAALSPVASLTGLNPVSGALVVGNSLDQQMDAALVGLASAGLSLAQAVNVIVANPTAPDVLAGPLQVPAASCAALKSGKYRMVNPAETDPARKDLVLTINAVALTATTADGTVIPFTANGDCKFTIDSVDETNTVLVSPGRVLVVYGQSKADASSRWVTVGLPEQTLPVSDLAGSWNMLNWDANGGSSIAGYVGSLDVTELNAAGQITERYRCSIYDCPDIGSHWRVVAATTAGGFDLFESSAKVGRAFLFKDLNKRKVFIAVTDGGQFVVGSRADYGTAGLQTVGQTINYRDFTLNGNGSVSDLLDETDTVTAIDSAARKITRVRTRDNRLETLIYDSSSTGLNYRAPNSCTNSVTGAVVNCAEIVQLPMLGMGIMLSMGLGTSPSTAFLSVSINKP